MLRTNANIEPGDSGGPLASTGGKVIGMDTAAATGQFGNGDQSDVGFAIPISRALSIAQQIIKGQASASVTIGGTGFLGVLVPGHKAGQVASPAQQPSCRSRTTRTAAASAAAASATSPGPGSSCLQNNSGRRHPGPGRPGQLGRPRARRAVRHPGRRRRARPRRRHHLGQRPAGDHANSLTGIMTGLHPGGQVKVTWVTTTGAKEAATMTLLPAPPA